MKRKSKVASKAKYVTVVYQVIFRYISNINHSSNNNNSLHWYSLQSLETSGVDESRSALLERFNGWKQDESWSKGF